MNFNFAYLIAGKTPYKPIFRTSIVEPQIKVCWITAEISYVSAYQWVHGVSRRFLFSLKLSSTSSSSALLFTLSVVRFPIKVFSTPSSFGFAITACRFSRRFLFSLKMPLPRLSVWLWLKISSTSRSLSLSELHREVGDVHKFVARKILPFEHMMTSAP